MALYLLSVTPFSPPLKSVVSIDLLKRCLPFYFLGDGLGPGPGISPSDPFAPASNPDLPWNSGLSPILGILTRSDFYSCSLPLGRVSRVPHGCCRTPPGYPTLFTDTHLREPCGKLCGSFPNEAHFSWLLLGRPWLAHPCFFPSLH